MRIAQVNHNLTTTDRRAPRSVGSHVGALSDKLVERGHNVDLFAATGSVSLARLITLPAPTQGSSERQKDNAVDSVRRAVARRALHGHYDVVHSHLEPKTRHLAAWRKLSEYALVCAVQHSEPINDAERDAATRYADIPHVAFSYSQANRLPLNWLGVVYHGVDTDALRPRPNDSRLDSAFVIGKICPGKGTAEAATAALNAGMAVNIAGPILDTEYFETSVGPLLGSGRATYLGVLNGEAKRRAYAESAVTICGTKLPETFCLVLAESLACGTPVATLNNGACPEVIDNGLTGFVVDSHIDLAAAAQSASLLDRRAIRDVAVKRFGLEEMARGYEQIFAENL